MKQKQTGMTLIEILIVVLVVSVGMAATAKFQGELLQAGATTKARTQALAFVQNEVENLRINHGAAAAGSQDDVVAGNATYDVTWSVSPIAGLADTDQYTATVVWNDNHNRAQSVQLGTVLYADRMLGGGAADNVVRAEAVKCIFIDCLPGEPGPSVTITNVIELETIGGSGSGDGNSSENPYDDKTANDLNPEDLEVMAGGDENLTGNNTVNSPGGSSDFKGTGEGDTFLITGDANSVSVDMSDGDDILQIIDNELNGNTNIKLGSGNDIFIVGYIGNSNSQSFDGGPGVDTICFSEWSFSDYEIFKRKSAIKNFEILLFNDGKYQFANGYSTDPSNIPKGCGEDYLDGDDGSSEEGEYYRYQVDFSIAINDQSKLDSLIKDGEYWIVYLDAEKGFFSKERNGLDVVSTLDNSTPFELFYQNYKMPSEFNSFYKIPVCSNIENPCVEESKDSSSGKVSYSLGEGSFTLKASLEGILEESLQFDLSSRWYQQANKTWVLGLELKVVDK